MSEIIRMIQVAARIRVSDIVFPLDQPCIIPSQKAPLFNVVHHAVAVLIPRSVFLNCTTNRIAVNVTAITSAIGSAI